MEEISKETSLPASSIRQTSHCLHRLNFSLDHVRYESHLAITSVDILAKKCRAATTTDSYRRSSLQARLGCGAGV